MKEEGRIVSREATLYQRRLYSKDRIARPALPVVVASAQQTALRPARRYVRRALNRTIYSVRGVFAQVEARPVIVLGNQKSGTSAIAHLLADFCGLSKTIDIPPLWPPVGIEIMRGRVKFASVVEQHRAYFSTKLIKEPMMTFFADQVLELFPECKCVFVSRDPRDNIRSLLNRRGIPGHLEEVGERYTPVSPPHNVVVDASVWGGEQENYVGVLAYRWNMAIDSHFQHSERMILAKYEDFASDKEGFITKLSERLSIPKRNEISSKLDIQYQPAGDRKVSREEFFGSRNLERIEQICGTRMAKLGYAVSLAQ
jgi:hypothetical protein